MDDLQKYKAQSSITSSNKRNKNIQNLRSEPVTSTWVFYMSFRKSASFIIVCLYMIKFHFFHNSWLKPREKLFVAIN